MKQLTLSRLNEILPGFNKRIHTEEDFWRICKRFKIIVKQMPLLVDGYHERRRGRYYILINSNLRGIKWLHTAFHELCHFLLDAPGHSDNYVLYRKSAGDKDDPRERFADAFATICIMPWPELKRLSNEDISDHYTLLQICHARILVYTDYGIGAT
jgi:Zn-dependent peptidase ImmA (M78 family)